MCFSFAASPPVNYRTGHILTVPFQHFTAELVKEAASLETGMSLLHKQVDSLSNQVVAQKSMLNGKDSEIKHLESLISTESRLHKLEEKLGKLSQLVINKLSQSTMVRFKTQFQ